MRLYFEDTKRAAAQKVRKTGNGSMLKASFKGGLPQGKKISDARGAFVTAGTVVGGQAPGGPGGENANAFDKLAPLKFTKSCSSGPGGGPGGGVSTGEGGASAGDASVGGGSASAGGASAGGGSVSAGPISLNY